MSSEEKKFCKMSRNQPKKEESKVNAMEEINRMKLLEERIRAPSVWGRVSCGLRFEDLQERRYDAAVHFLKKHYLPYHVLWRSIELIDDEHGVEEFVHNVKIWMKDKMSLAVIKESTDKLVGVLLMRIQEKAAFTRTFSRVKITNNPRYAEVMKFYNSVEEPVDLFQELDCRRYLKIYIMALKERYRHRGVGKELIKSINGLAESAFVPGIAGIFTNARTVAIATELGFKIYNQIYYTKYLIDKHVVFPDTGMGNYGACLMALRLNFDEPTELNTAISSRFKIKSQQKIDNLEDPQEQQEQTDENPGPSE